MNQHAENIWMINPVGWLQKKETNGIRKSVIDKNRLLFLYIRISILGELFPQVYNRRKKLCKETEKKFWNELTEKFMTEEETDSDDLDTFVQRRQR